MEKVTILGKTLQADFTSPAFAGKYEDALQNVGKEFARAEQAERGSEGLKIQCNAVIHAFDELFGTGSAQKVLGKETNLLVCLDAFTELCGVYRNQINPLVAEKAKKAREMMPGAGK